MWTPVVPGRTAAHGKRLAAPRIPRRPHLLFQPVYDSPGSERSTLDRVGECARLGAQTSTTPWRAPDARSVSPQASRAGGSTSRDEL